MKDTTRNIMKTLFVLLIVFLIGGLIFISKVGFGENGLIQKTSEKSLSSFTWNCNVPESQLYYQVAPGFYTLESGKEIYLLAGVGMATQVVGLSEDIAVPKCTSDSPDIVSLIGFNMVSKETGETVFLVQGLGDVGGAIPPLP